MCPLVECEPTKGEMVSVLGVQCGASQSAVGHFAGLSVGVMGYSSELSVISHGANGYVPR